MGTGAIKEIHRALALCSFLLTTAACGDANLVPLRPVAGDERAPTPRVPPRNEYDLLRLMPETVRQGLESVAPDANGLVGSNRSGFTCAGLQRGAMQNMILGIARGDMTVVLDSFRAIDATFAHQTPQGNFGDSAYCVSYWLCDLAHALLVLADSPLRDSYATRVQTILPHLRSAAAWLALPAQSDALARDDDNVPYRLLFDANALALSGLLLNDPNLQAKGLARAARALPLQGSDGAFLHKGGTDTTLQAIALWKLSWLTIRFGDAAFDSAVRSAGQWEMTRIAADGTIDDSGNTVTGNCKGPDSCEVLNVGETIWGLLYWGALVSDRGLDAATRVAARP